MAIAERGLQSPIHQAKERQTLRSYWKAGLLTDRELASRSTGIGDYLKKNGIRLKTNFYPRLHKEFESTDGIYPFQNPKSHHYNLAVDPEVMNQHLDEIARARNRYNSEARQTAYLEKIEAAGNSANDAVFKEDFELYVERLLWYPIAPRPHPRGISAGEITKHSALKVAERFSEFDPSNGPGKTEMENFNRWAYVVGIRAATDLLRRTTRLSKRLMDIEHLIATRENVPVENPQVIQMLVQNALQTISAPRQKEVTDLMLQGLSFSQIAAKLGEDVAEAARGRIRKHVEDKVLSKHGWKPIPDLGNVNTLKAAAQNQRLVAIKFIGRWYSTQSHLARYTQGLPEQNPQLLAIAIKDGQNGNTNTHYPPEEYIKRKIELLQPILGREHRAIVLRVLSGLTNEQTAKLSHTTPEEVERVISQARDRIEQEVLAPEGFHILSQFSRNTRTLRDAAFKGILYAVKVLGHWYATKEAFNEYLEKHARRKSLGRLENETVVYIDQNRMARSEDTRRNTIFAELNTILDALPQSPTKESKERRLRVIKRAMGGESINDIAQAERMSETAVKVMLFRARDIFERKTLIPSGFIALKHFRQYKIHQASQKGILTTVNVLGIKYVDKEEAIRYRQLNPPFNESMLEQGYTILGIHETLEEFYTLTTRLEYARLLVFRADGIYVKKTLLEQLRSQKPWAA